MLLTREVAPRNALVPGGGQPLSVGVAPDSRIFDIIPSNVRVLDDLSASGIVAGRPGGVSIGGLLNQGLGRPETGSLSGGAGSSEAGRGGGIGSTVNGAIGVGMGALRGALGSFRPGGGK